MHKPKTYCGYEKLGNIPDMHDVCLICIADYAQYDWQYNKYTKK